MFFLRRWMLLKGTKNCPIRKVATLVMLGCVTGLAMMAADAVVPKPDTRHLLLESRALKAEEDNFELREILAGRLTMVEPIGGMAKVAKIEWELVQRVVR